MLKVGGILEVGILVAGRLKQVALLQIGILDTGSHNEAIAKL
jgi:hypothetical protein